jgi:hypothetical protein
MRVQSHCRDYSAVAVAGLCHLLVNTRLVTFNRHMRMDDVTPAVAVLSCRSREAINCE